MDERQRLIVEDLSGVFSGEIRCDDLAVSMYASDGSLFQVRPLGVAFPRSAEDVCTLAKYASENSLPLVPRGSGSSVNGAALGTGLIVDFSRHMRAISEINDKTVTVQAGVVHEQLNRELRKFNRYFPPDPSTTSTTTIGGMLGVDAAGSRAVRVGSTRDHVVSLDLVLASGQLLTCGTEPTGHGEDSDDSFNDMQLAPTEEIKRAIVQQLSSLLTANRARIERHQPPLFRNTSGYYLRGIQNGRSLNLARMLVGSEGTLGLITSAKLHTLPLPDNRGAVLLLFGQMEHAIDAVSLITPQQPSACDLLDRRLLILGRENDSRFAHIIPPTVEAGLLVEQTGFSRQQTQDRITQVIAAVHARFRDAVVALEAYDYDDVEFLWELPRKVVPLLARMRGDTRPLPFMEDVSIPPEALKEFFVQSQRVLQRHEVTASLYSHAASGQIHMRPFLPFPRHADSTRMAALAQDMFDIVIGIGGSISGEHGDGLSRSAFVHQQYGPLYPVFREIKSLFDPQHLLNPGKIVTHETLFPTGLLRPETETTSELVQLQLNWKPGQLAAATEQCNGCGLCRSQKDELRMCPFFRVEHSEEASPRAKANVMRSLLNDELPRTIASSPEMERLVSLCFNCKQCDLECPTHTPISQLMTELKAQVVETNGLSRSNWFLSRAHELGGLACRFSWLINPFLRSRIGRWLIEKSIGIHRLRRLPTFARKSFLDAYGKDDRELSGVRVKSVVYFVDHFANYHDPELAHAFLSIMERHAVQVHIPDGQSGSGMAMISAGDLASARRVAETNLHELAEFAREGMPIVCTEPAAALCLRDEYPLLLDHPDTEVVSKQTIEAGAYLLAMHAEGRLQTKFSELPIRVGYHTPCHVKALKAGTPLRDLLQLIPGLTLVPIEAGCSGMAGAYGLIRENYETSLAIGRELLDTMKKPDFVIGTTECSSCRMQMEHDSPIPTIHPIKILAAAYGLLPNLRKQLLEAAERR